MLQRIVMVVVFMLARTAVVAIVMAGSIVVFVTRIATVVAIIVTANTKAARVMHVQQVTIVVIRWQLSLGAYGTL